MRLEGSLDAFSLPDIFALLAMTKKTGTLELRRSDVRGVVHFVAGGVSGAISDLSRQQMGRRLVAAGVVGDRTLAQAVDRVAADESVGLVKALAESAAVDDAVLHEALTEQIVDAVFDLLRWTDGEFSFQVDAPNPDEIGLALSIDDILTPARHRLDMWSAVSAAVPSPSSVLSLAISIPEDAEVTREEWAVLALVDGRRTVAEVCDYAGRGEYAAVSTLATLVHRGLVRVDDSEGIASLGRRQGIVARLETPAVPEQPEPEAEVTPARPEPFLPRRRPEHPEELAEPVAAAIAARAAVRPPSVQGTAAVAPMVEPGVIERDPSVNKSLLLRLIAGVRGL